MKQLTKKICLLGDFAVGKTSLVRRFVEGRFDERYLSTIGVRVSRRVLQFSFVIPTTLTMMIWDTSGSEPFSHVVRNYYQGSSGALLVADVTRLETVSSLVRYAEEFRQVNPLVPLVIVANKADLEGQRVVSHEMLDDVALRLQSQWLLGSARTGDGVELAFQTLGSLICSERSAL